MKILIIDDDSQIRLMLRLMLSWAGYEVVEAANGREGLLLHQEHRADLVITDLIMPEQEGLETISMLRARYPELKIIAVSGGGRIRPEGYLPTALELGANRAFSKPFDIHLLAAAVRELLEQQ